MFLARMVFFRLHESPRYLVHAGRPEEAIVSLQLISKFNGSELALGLDDVSDHPIDPHDRPRHQSSRNQEDVNEGISEDEDDSRAPFLARHGVNDVERGESEGTGGGGGGRAGGLQDPEGTLNSGTITIFDAGQDGPIGGADGLIEVPRLLNPQTSRDGLRPPAEVEQKTYHSTGWWLFNFLF